MRPETFCLRCMDSYFHIKLKCVNFDRSVYMRYIMGKLSIGLSLIVSHFKTYSHYGVNIDLRHKHRFCAKSRFDDILISIMVTQIQRQKFQPFVFSVIIKLPPNPRARHNRFDRSMWNWVSFHFEQARIYHTTTHSITGQHKRLPFHNI